MKNGKLQIGFIGCGGIAHQKHFPGMKPMDVDMAAFCDIIPERATQAAEKYGCTGAKVYTDYRELLKDPTIDAVHVLTPNVSHCEISVAALEAGKHVLCEKPMAATVADAQKMLDARDKSGKMLTIGYQYRHFHVNKTAKQVVDDGWLGEIYYAEATNLRRRGVPTWGVFTDKEKQGGGPLIDIGTHSLDLTLFMMNNYEVDYVVGTSFEKLGRLLDEKTQGQTNWRGQKDVWNPETYEVEDSAMGHIKMKNGAVINLRTSWAINICKDAGGNGQATILLAGTKGGLDTIEQRVRLNHVVAGQQTLSYVGEKVEEFMPGFSMGEAPPSQECVIWVNALKGEGELFVTADQAFIVTKILAAVYESSKTGKQVFF